jgi:hypothetical protein
MRESIFEDPPVTPFVECPNCRRLVEFGTQRCPDCYEEIREDYARLSVAIVVTNTRACAMANTIKTLDVSAAIALGVVLFTYLVPEPPTITLISVTWPTLALLAIVSWFIRFGRFKLGDDDYARARRQMGLRLMAWSLFTVALWSFYFLVLLPNSVAP